MNPGEWFVDDDYPADARSAKQQGLVVVKAGVNERGRVNSCEVTTSSDSVSLDTLTCRLVTARGRFLPALDQAGKAVPSTYSISTRWVLRNDDPVPLGGAWRTAALLSIDPAGNIVSCKDEPSGSVPVGVSRDLCPLARTMPAGYAIMARGGTAPGNVTVTMESSFVADGDPAPAMLYDGDNRTIVSLRVIHAQVDTAGTVSGCQVLAQSGSGSPDPCASPPGPFLPIAAPRGITIKTAISRPNGG